MNKKLLLEFVPLTLFLVFGLATFFRIPYVGLITVLSGVFLGGFYFYGAFWLFGETGTPIAIRIIAGLIYSMAIIATIYCLQHWPFWKLFGTISYAGLGVMMIICLVNFRSSAYKPLLYRCLLFIVVLSSIYIYRNFAG